LEFVSGVEPQILHLGIVLDLSAEFSWGTIIDGSSGVVIAGTASPTSFSSLRAIWIEPLRN